MVVGLKLIQFEYTATYIIFSINTHKTEKLLLYDFVFLKLVLKYYQVSYLILCDKFWNTYLILNGLPIIHITKVKTLCHAVFIQIFLPWKFVMEGRELDIFYLYFKFTTLQYYWFVIIFSTKELLINLNCWR